MGRGSRCALRGKESSMHVGRKLLCARRQCTIVIMHLLTIRVEVRVEFHQSTSSSSTLVPICSSVFITWYFNATWMDGLQWIWIGNLILHTLLLRTLGESMRSVASSPCSRSIVCPSTSFFACLPCVKW